MSGWTLHVLGCRGSWPVEGPDKRAFGGATSCYILKKEAHAVLLDCGTGLAQAGPLLRDCRQIDILLGHVHYDHILGLAAGHVFPPEASVRILAPFDCWGGTAVLDRFLSPPFWPFTPEFPARMAVPVGEERQLAPGLTFCCHPAGHPDGGCMLRLKTPDWSLLYACDHEHTAPVPEDLAAGCSLLLWDAMYTDEEYPAHAGWGHSTWQQGCREAARLGAKALLLTHHHPDRTDRELAELETAARALFPNARFARTGDALPLTPAKD